MRKKLRICEGPGKRRFSAAASLSSVPVSTGEGVSEERAPPRHLLPPCKSEHARAERRCEMPPERHEMLALIGEAAYGILA
jgi:hypothetical protein